MTLTATSKTIFQTSLVICVRKPLVFFSLVIGSMSLLVVLHPAAGQDAGQVKRSWMISGAVARGLTEGSVATEPATEKQTWMADISETEWTYIIVHHSATESGSVESIHADHLNRRDANGNPWLGIGYHFVIGNGQGMPDGTVQATFRWKEQIHGAHSGMSLYNARGIGICLIGDFQQNPPSHAQIASLKQLVKVLATRHRITPDHFMGHAAVKPTACPGKHFPLNEIRRVISRSAS
ncbi:MAG TPA: peptidoglycan recognition family protein [Planctomycetaceae bacterium]|nr:peptidoglycan recognition family protein [Planctomycetaceae bacterium]